MRRIPILCSLIVAGCSHGQIGINAGAVTTSGGGTTLTSSGGGLAYQGSGTSTATLIGLGIAGAVIYSAEQRGPGSGYGTTYTANPFMAVTPAPRAPELAPGRRVNEQDCSRPIADPSVNLKCR